MAFQQMTLLNHTTPAAAEACMCVQADADLMEEEEASKQPPDN